MKGDTVPLATLTSKGQVTIPKEVRDKLDLEAGDQLDFVVSDDGSVRLRKRALRVDDVFGAFAHRGKEALSVEDMDRAIARGSAASGS